MMKANKVSSGAASSGYYKAEGYYGSESKEAEEASFWYGKGTSDLGLSGRVDEGVFNEMLQGQTFDHDETKGLVPGRTMSHAGTDKHVPGIDLTFSAPKSVSIAALVSERKELVSAHDEAVRETLDYIEKHYVKTRRQVDGKIEQVSAGMIAGVFRHDTSRRLDPNMHSHAVLPNMVKNEDGTTTALDNRQIFKMQFAMSQMYRGLLATKVAEQGWSVERYGREGYFRIKEVSKEVEETFSKRRQDIEKVLDERGKRDDPVSAQLVAMFTRAAKSKNVDRNALRETWTQEARSAGLEPQELKPSSALAKGRVDGVMTPPQSVEYALAHLSQNETKFESRQLLSTALRFNGQGRTEDIVNEIDIQIKRGKLFPTSTTTNQGDHLLATKASVAVERQIVTDLKLSHEGKGVRPGRVGLRKGSTYIEERLANGELTEGQRDAIRLSLSGETRYVAVQGYAGTGKTYMLQKLRQYAETTGYKVEGLAPTKAAVQELQEAIPNTETLQGRLARRGSKFNETTGDKTIVVVDEASFVNNKQMHDFIRQMDRAEVARVVLVGDIDQLEGVGAGSPFKLMQTAGMKTATMDDIRRQRDPRLLEAVKKTISGDINAAFENLAGKIHQPGSQMTLETSVANQFLALSPDQRAQTGIVTPTNAVRRNITAEIREALKHEGSIGTEDKTLRTLSPARLSTAEASDPRSYQAGDIVMTYRDVKSVKMLANTEYRVVDRTADGRGITVLNPATKEEIALPVMDLPKLARTIDAFTEEKVEVSVGEPVKFRLSDGEQGVSNGDRGTITEINQDSVTVQMASGDKLEVSDSSLAAKGIEQAYALTAHDFQGKTVDRILIAMTADESLATQRSFYVAISRAKNDLSLTTNDAERLAKNIQETVGEVPTALEEYLSRIADLKKENDREEPKPPALPERDEKSDNQKDDQSKPSEYEQLLQNVERAERER